MKTRHFFLAAAALVSALTACQKKTEDFGPEKVELNTVEVSLPAEGGEVSVGLTATVDWKAQIPAEAQEWLVLSPDGGSAAASAQTVKVKALKNDGNDRSAEVVFAGGSRTATLAIKQAGAKGGVDDGKIAKPESAAKVTIKDYLSKQVDTKTWYELTGKIVSIAKADYGNITIKDETASVFVYGLVKEWAGGENDQSFSKIGLKEGDVVTLWTLRGEYGGEPQAGGSSTSGGAPAIYRSHTAGVADTYPEGSVILSFPDDNSANNKVNVYDKEWTAKSGSNSFTMKAFNNYEWNGWTFVRCGRKAAASVASIATETPVAAKVAKVLLRLDSVSAADVNSMKLSVCSDKDFSKEICTVDPDGAIAPGEVSFAVPSASQAAGLYYKLVIDCKVCSANPAKNGFVQISKVIYVAAE